VTVRKDQSGQAAVELVAVLPLLIALLAGACQVALVGHAAWSAGAAARAAARAHALGRDPRAAARAHLPPGLERGLSVRDAARSDEVTVTVRVPSLIGAVRAGRVSATSAFAAQR
jgi:hypothetical protein